MATAKKLLVKRFPDNGCVALRDYWIARLEDDTAVDSFGFGWDSESAIKHYCKKMKKRRHTLQIQYIGGYYAC